MSGPVSSAVVSEIVSRATSFLTGKCSKHKNVHEWIDRLKMARIKIKSALQESEVFDIDIDEPLHEWQEKLKEAVSEAEETLSNFQAEILNEKPNQTVEGGSSARDQSMQEEKKDATLVHPASNLREAVTCLIDLEANLPHDPFMHEEGSDDVTLVHPASNLREAVTHQVNLEAKLHHDQSVQEEGSEDATVVHPAPNLREAITRQVDLGANLAHDKSMQEEGSDDVTLVHPSPNLREAVTCQVNLETNFPQDQSMQEERSNDATLVHAASNLKEALTRQVNLEANLPHDQLMQEEGSDDATLVHPASNLWEAINRKVNLDANLPHDQSMQEPQFYLGTCIREEVKWPVLPNLCSLSSLRRLIIPNNGYLFPNFASPWPVFIKRLSEFYRSLDPRTLSLLDTRMMVHKYLENDEKVSRLIKIVEKLEKTAGDIGHFIELLKLQSKRSMCRKRKRSGVALLGFFMVLSHKLLTYALFRYGEEPYLLVIKRYRANCNTPTGITSEIFIRFIM